MKAIIRFVLVLALGAVIGYVLHPTISQKLEGTKVEKAVNATSEVANEALQEALTDSTETETE